MITPLQEQERLVIYMEPTEELFKKVVEYFNSNLDKGNFDLIRRKKHYTLKDAEKWLRRYREGNQIVAVALIGNKIVGAAHLNHCREDDHIPWKLSITVDGEYWRQRIGTRIMECLIWQAKKRNISKMRALPRADNVAAVSFLEKIGFKTISDEYRMEESGKEVILNCMVLVI